MAKDPRFNFYTDNWIGGTEGFTLEQEGAYLALIIMQSKVGRFTHMQAIDKLMQKTRGNATASAGLWQFLMPKFSREADLFWSVRLENEMEKSKRHSKLQSDRAKKRFEPPFTNAAASSVDDACNSTGIENGNGSVEKGVQGETKPPLSDQWFADILDEATIETLKLNFRGKDVMAELEAFKAKARAAPATYQHRDKGGIMLAIHAQLRNAKNKKSNVNPANKINDTAPAETFGTI